MRVLFAVEPFDRLELAEDEGVDGEVALTVVLGETGELPILWFDALRGIPIPLISSALNWIKGAGLRTNPELHFLLDL